MADPRGGVLLASCGVAARRPREYARYRNGYSRDQGAQRCSPSLLSTYRSTRTYTATAAPVRLRIPSIDVDTSLEPLRRGPDSSIEVPRTPSSAGWWAGGSRPGQIGPAVILGHVDTKTGPAVFDRLDELSAGDEILVDGADDSTARFLVSSLAFYPKTEFPSELVYYPTETRTPTGDLRGPNRWFYSTLP